MSSLSMSLSKASKDTMPSFLHFTRQRVSEITATKKRRIIWDYKSFSFQTKNRTMDLLPTVLGWWSLSNQTSKEKNPRFSQANLITSSHLPQALTHLETDLNIASPLRPVENGVFSKLNQWDISTVGPHLVRLTISLGVFEHSTDLQITMSSQRLWKAKVCKSSWGAVAYQSSWKHPWWPANCHQLSKLPKGKGKKPQIFQFPSAMSQQKLKVKMLWATGETCKTQKHPWHGSDWPSEASLGDFAHPFLVPPLPVDASMGLMSVTFMLKNHSRLCTLFICSEKSFQFSAAQLASASSSAGTAPLAGIVHSTKAQTPSKQTAETSEPHGQNIFCRHPLPQPLLWRLYLAHIWLVA